MRTGRPIAPLSLAAENASGLRSGRDARRLRKHWLSARVSYWSAPADVPTLWWRGVWGLPIRRSANGASDFWSADWTDCSMNHGQGRRVR